MTKEIQLTITDLNDFDLTLKALDNLYRTILRYYAEENKNEEIKKLVLCEGVFWGTILKELGLTEDDLFKEDID